MSRLIFYFQQSFTGWMPTSIYQQLYNDIKNKYGSIVFSDHSINYNNNYASRFGPHHLIIENIDTKYYKVITYWDSAKDLLNNDLGWYNDKCLGIYSCVDANIYPSIKPISYCTYNETIENTINTLNIDFNNKFNKNLCFRGFLYGMRFLLENQSEKYSKFIKIYSNRLSYEDYIKELNTYQIGLSLNGAAEICNRDIEILGVGSVLLRPKLISTKFYKDLVPQYHYISFDITNDPQDQIDIIIQKLEELTKDKDLMNYIAFNGRDWYNKYGSRFGNISVLLDQLDIEELL